MPETAARLDEIVGSQALVVLGSVEDLRRDLAGSVHEARVGVRKLRSTLAVFSPMLRDSPSSRLRRDLRWFARQLSLARDAQVVRERVTAAMAGADAPPELSAEVLAELDRRSTPAWLQAEASLSDPRAGLLLSRLDRARCHGLARRRGTGESLTERAGAELHELLENAARSCAEDADDDTIHHLRKQVKRVRFAVSSQRGLPGGTQVARSLQALQDSLGAYQDAVATAVQLEAAAAALSAGGSGPAAALAGRIVAGQQHLAADARAAFPRDVDRLARAAGTFPR